MHDLTDAVILERTGGVATELTVALVEAGPAVPGVNHVPLPATVTLPAGSPELVVPVTALADTRGTVVELAVAVRPGEGYTVGDPAGARISFVRPQDPTAAPTECGFGIAGGPALVRETVVGARPEPVVVGSMLVPIGLVPLGTDAYAVTVTGGSLPDGLTLGRAGVFGGQATATGRSEATIEACRVGSVLDTCVTATLTVTVTAAPDRTGGTDATREQLPVTGVPTHLLVLGVAQLLVGTAILARTRRPQPRGLRCRQSPRTAPISRRSAAARSLLPR